jgi:D-cysteine desulfhydrase family pyridoxal phosphate-dependent enzyme
MAANASGNRPSVGRLDAFPRAGVASIPTPIEAMANLSAALAGDRGGPDLFIKRDDLTGLGMGGNKARQVDFWLGDARAKGADVVLITGAVQSNYVRTAAAGAARMGMACHIQLEERVKDPDHTYRVSGNVLLDRILGATLHSYPDGEDEAGADANLHAIADGLRAEGRTPYIIPLGPGHDPIGALGYVDAAREILGQVEAGTTDLSAVPDEIVIASGSAHTHAGLLVGLRALGCDVPVLGVCVRRAAELQRPRAKARCDEIAALIGVDPPSDADIAVFDGALGPGYGVPGADTVEAMTLTARTEGIILDPVYTAKVMAGLIAEARRGRWRAGQRVLFVHTGGAPAVFAYEPVLSRHLGA